MSYAIRKDGQGWRTVESEADCAADEIYSETQPDLITPDLAVIERNKRDALLNDTQWLVQRHRDQIEVGEQTTLTNEEYKALLTYRQALRDVTLQKDFPTEVIYPEYPI